MPAVITALTIGLTDEITSPVTARYEVPKKLTLIVGNAGRAWASLYVGKRKFCYKGNAPWITFDIGTEFDLKYEKLMMSSPCSERKEDMEPETKAVIAQGDVVKLEYPRRSLRYSLSLHRGGGPHRS